MRTRPVLILLTLLLLKFSFLAAQLPVASNGKFVTVNDSKIYYEEYGAGEPLILLHGFGGTCNDWKIFIPEYSRNHRVIAWDMRGHGRSTNPDTSVTFSHAAAARDLLALIDNLKLNKVKAIGHSSGGIVLLTAATMSPARFEAIIPMSAQLYFTPQVRSFVEANGKPRIPNPDFDRLHGKEKGTLLGRQFYQFRKTYGDPALTPDQLATITARTLIVHGDNDFVPVAHAWEMFQNIPKSHLWISPNTGHGPHFGPGNDTDFIRRTTEFLKGDWDKAR